MAKSGIIAWTMFTALSIGWLIGVLNGQEKRRGIGKVLSVYAFNPHYFQTADGKPVILIGDYTWGTFSDVNYDYKAMLDTLKANGLNFARVWLFLGQRNRL